MVNFKFTILITFDIILYMAYELSQVFVVFASACLVSSFYFKEKIKTLIFMILACGFFATHYFLFSTINKSALVGGVIIALTIIRFIFEFLLDKKQSKKYDILNTIFFDILYIICGILTFDSWECVFPIIAIVLVTSLKVLKNSGVYKASIIPFCVLFGAYDFIIGTYTSFGIEIVAFISAIVVLCMHFIMNKKIVVENIENDKTINKDNNINNN